MLKTCKKKIQLKLLWFITYDNIESLKYVWIIQMQVKDISLGAHPIMLLPLLESI